MLTGNAGNDTLDGGLGADTMRGGADDDIYHRRQCRRPRRGECRRGHGRGPHLAGERQPRRLRQCRESHRHRRRPRQSLTGNSGNNVVTGGAGNDVLRLYDGGNDSVFGGTGNDNIFFIGDADRGRRRQRRRRASTRSSSRVPTASLTLTANVTQIENISILGGNNINFGEPGTNRYDYVLTTHDVEFRGGGAGADQRRGASGRGGFHLQRLGRDQCQLRRLRRQGRRHA